VLVAVFLKAVNAVVVVVVIIIIVVAFS